MRSNSIHGISPPSLMRRAACAAVLCMACSWELQAGDRRTYVPGDFDYKEPTITAEKARELAASRGIITLAHVKELTPDVARNLVGNERGIMLTLPAVETLDADTARELARFKGNLRLWRLKTLTPKVASVIAETKTGEDLDLCGLQNLSVEVAGILATTKVPALWLGLREIDVELARALVPMRGHLIFPDLETLSPEAAAELTKHKGPLNLGAVKLSRETATALLAHKSWLSFAGLQRLEPGVGDILAQFEGSLAIDLAELDSVPLARKVFRQSGSSGAVGALTTISPEIARELVHSGASVSMHRLETLSPEAARELARERDHIIFLKLAALTPETARALTDRPESDAPVYMPGITVLVGPDGVAVAEALASTSGSVHLERLERVSAQALAVLRTKPTIKLPPDEKLTIVP